MSLYNLLFGENSDSETILSLLNLTKDDFYRFRNVSVCNNEIHVYTRGGGNNRNCWNKSPYAYNQERDPEDDNVYCSNEHVEDCVEFQHGKLIEHPLYLRDVDDDYDCTYCTFIFKMPQLK